MCFSITIKRVNKDTERRPDGSRFNPVNLLASQEGDRNKNEDRDQDVAQVQKNPTSLEFQRQPPSSYQSKILQSTLTTFSKQEEHHHHHHDHHENHKCSICTFISPHSQSFLQLQVAGRGRSLSRGAKQVAPRTGRQSVTGPPFGNALQTQQLWLKEVWQNNPDLREKLGCQTCGWHSFQRQRAQSHEKTVTENKAVTQSKQCWKLNEVGNS